MGGQVQLPVPSVTVTFGLEARWGPHRRSGCDGRNKNPSPVGKQTWQPTRSHSLTELPEIIKRMGHVIIIIIIFINCNLVVIRWQ